MATGEMATQRAVGDHLGYTTWELQTEHPVENAFTFCEQRTRTLNGPLEAMCVSVPDASRQTGRLTVRKSPESGFRNHQFEAISDSSGEPTFSFDPDLVVSSSGPAFEFLPPTHHTESVAIRVWDSVLCSQMTGETSVQNRIVWKIENEGVSRFPIRLPSGWNPNEVRELWIDGNPATEIQFKSSDDSKRGGVLSVAIPINQRYLTIAMTYMTQPSGTGYRQLLTPQIPSLAS